MHDRQVAYLLIAHSANAQLALLIETLCQDPRSAVYLHLDAKATRSAPLDALELAGKVALVQRVRVNWGGFSMIRATRNLLNAALADPKNVHFAVLSGSCFPLRRMQEVNDLLLTKDSDAFSLWDIISEPSRKISHAATPSVEKRYFMDVELINPSRSKLMRAAFKIYKRINLWLPYRLSPGIQVVQGSQWFMATRSTAQMLADASPELDRFFEGTFAPDETFFQTRYWLHSATTGQYPPLVAQRALIQGRHYIGNNDVGYRSLRDRAQRRVDRRAITSQDVQQALQMGAVFTRKCSLERCQEILSIGDC